MGKWFKNILAVVILGFLLWYLSKHWQELKALLKVRPTQLLALYALCLFQMCSSAAITRCLLNTLKVKTFLWDMVLLQNASALLNYLPMRFGTLFRANYLKRRYGLSYAHFATFFTYLTFQMTMAASIIGLVVLLAVYGYAGYGQKILAVVFLGAFACSLVLLFFPLPIPVGPGKLRTTLRNFLAGRKQVVKSKKAMAVCTGLLVVNFLFTALRIGIIYNSLGQDIHPGGCVILGAIGFVALFIGITPGGLGIRELVLGSGAIVLGVSLEVGLLVAIVSRAIMLSYLFVVGGICTGWLWHKYPADFKKLQANASTEN